MYSLHSILLQYTVIYNSEDFRTDFGFYFYSRKLKVSMKYEPTPNLGSVAQMV